MLRFRQATRDDLATLVDVGTRTYREHFADIWTPAGLEAYLGRQFDRGRLAGELTEGKQVRYELATDEQGVVGLAKVKPGRAVPTRPEERGLELEKIYFLAASVGRGYGALFLEHIVELARTQREPLVWLDVLKSNEAGLRFYERNGFERCGEIPFATDKLDIGMWVMRRALAP